MDASKAKWREQQASPSTFWQVHVLPRGEPIQRCTALKTLTLTSTKSSNGQFCLQWKSISILRTERWPEFFLVCWRFCRARDCFAWSQVSFFHGELLIKSMFFTFTVYSLHIFFFFFAVTNERCFIWRVSCDRQSASSSPADCQLFNFYSPPPPPHHSSKCYLGM